MSVMDRLTMYNYMGAAVYKQPYTCDVCGEPLYRLPDYGNGSPTDRLAAYEDTGLTPEQIREIDRMYAELGREVQQYRELERQIKEDYSANVDIKTLIKYFIETIFKGEQHGKFCVLTNEDAEEWEAYQAIGTVEECREAREKEEPREAILVQPKPQKPYQCPSCGYTLEIGYRRCISCGQLLKYQSRSIEE